MVTSTNKNQEYIKASHFNELRTDVINGVINTTTNYTSYSIFDFVSENLYYDSTYKVNFVLNTDYSISPYAISTNVIVRVPILISYKATITSFNASYYKSSASSLTVKIINNDSGTVAQLTANVDNTLNTQEQSCNIYMDYSGYCYWLKIQMNADTLVDNVKLYSIRLAYTLNEVLP